MADNSPIAAVAAAVETSAGRGVPRLRQPAPVDKEAAELHRLRKATGDFEALFLAKLLKPLEKAVESSSSGQSLGSNVMMGVAIEKMAETIAGQGGIGLADVLYESMKDHIAAAAEPPAPESDAAAGDNMPKPIALEKDQIEMFDLIQDPR